MRSKAGLSQLQAGGGTVGFKSNMGKARLATNVSALPDGGKPCNADIKGTPNLAVTDLASYLQTRCAEMLVER